MKSLILSRKFVAVTFLLLLFTGNAAAQSEFSLFHEDHILIYIVGVIFVTAFIVVRIFKKMEKSKEAVYYSKRSSILRRRKEIRRGMVGATVAVNNK